MSRQRNTVLNVKVNLIFYIVTAILAFFSRKVFLDSLGDDFIGLTATLGNMLGLMNLAELGIGTAVAVTLYKSLFDKNHQEINEIVSVLGYLYQRVGLGILAVGFCISLFFPFVFNNSSISLLGVYITFYTLLASAVLGYFINFKQIVLNADQKNYIVSLYYNVAIIVKVILQVGVVYVFHNFYLWLIIEIVVMIGYYILLDRKISKQYPWLLISKEEGKLLFKKYSYMWVKVKQVFVQKISNLVVNQTDQILIFTFANLQTVAFFGNYSLLIDKLASLIDSLFSGTSGSVGNLIAEGDKKNILKVFWELTSFRYFLNGVFFCFMFFCVEPIIGFWLGEKYFMDKTTLYLLLANFYILQSRVSVDLFKDAYGLFQDTWAPISESIINLVLSLILGYYIGVNGILLGTLISAILIKTLWKPYFLFEKGFRLPVSDYWKRVLVYYIGLVMTFLLISFFQYYFQFAAFGKFAQLIIYCFLVFMFSSMLYLLFLLTVDNGFRIIIRRFYEGIIIQIKK